MLAVTFMAVPTALPAPAMAATGDRTVTLTLKCTNSACQGGWNWYQGGTLLSTGSLSGHVDATTTGTATQPAAADEVELAVGAGAGCGTNEFHTFTPGSAINFTVTLDVRSKTYSDSCRASFNMKS
jgi:hypothetical protein